MVASSPALSSSLSPADAAVAAVAGHAVWRGDARAAHADASATPTGFAELDAELPGGGWPAGGLVDLLQPAPAGAELRLLAPLLGATARAALSPRPIVCIAPPAQPCAPALAALGIALERLVWLTPTGTADAAWCAEQALRSGACAAVLWWSGWLPGVVGRVGGAAISSNPALWRRLHLAAQAGASPLFALRPLALRAQASPAPLRLALTPAGIDSVNLQVFKRRGPPMPQPLRLLMPGPARVAAAPAAPSAPGLCVDRVSTPPATAPSPGCIDTPPPSPARPRPAPQRAPGRRLVAVI